MSFVNNRGREVLLNRTIDTIHWTDGVAASFQLMLLLSTSSYGGPAPPTGTFPQPISGTESRDLLVINDGTSIETLAEYSGTNYTAGGNTTTGRTTIWDQPTSERLVYTMGNVSFTSLGASGGSCDRALIYFNKDAAMPPYATSIPLWLFSGFPPFDGTGSTVTFTPNTNGLYRIGG